jgi:hypothetical protein
MPFPGFSVQEVRYGLDLRYSWARPLLLSCIV